jgi:hypothetical protein
MNNIAAEHAGSFSLTFTNNLSAIEAVIDKCMLLSHALTSLPFNLEAFDLWEGLFVGWKLWFLSTHTTHQAKIIIGIDSMRKKEPKQPTKGGATFSNAMSALSEMCYDYDKLGLNEGATKQVFTGKKPEVVTTAKKTNEVKHPSKTQVVAPTEPQLLNPPKPKLELLKLNPVKLENKRDSEHVTSFSISKREYKEPEHVGDQLKASEIVENARLEFAYYPEQVKQGGLGDCYLISAISCLAHRDNILNRCIDYLPPDLISKAAEFQIRLFESGVYTTVRL